MRMSTYGEDIAAKIKIVRYVLAKADDKGLTHGEKHYILQTCLMLLHDLENELNGNRFMLERHHEPVIAQEDIPF